MHGSCAIYFPGVFKIVFYVKEDILVQYTFLRSPNDTQLYGECESYAVKSGFLFEPTRISCDKNSCYVFFRSSNKGIYKHGLIAFSLASWILWGTGGVEKQSLRRFYKLDDVFVDWRVWLVTKPIRMWKLIETVSFPVKVANEGL